MATENNKNVTYTDNTTFTKLETNLMLFFMRLDKVEETILISVKTLQISLINGYYSKDY